MNPQKVQHTRDSIERAAARGGRSAIEEIRRRGQSQFRRNGHPQASSRELAELQREMAALDRAAERYRR